MKKLSTLFLSIFISITLCAQTSVKKYVLYEVFSNSHSQLMASKNPTFYVLLDKYAADIRHMTYYVPFPTDSCIMYQENKPDFDARRSAYNVSVTPWVMSDGGLLGLPLGKDLVLESTVKNSLGKFSPIEITVTETSNIPRDVTVKVKTVGVKPSSKYKLLVVLVEKTVNKTTTNGEMVHRDVYRKMLTTNFNGDTIVLANQGQEISFNYSYTAGSGWNPNELYVVAFVQTLPNGNILNTGTRFDGLVSNFELLDESVLELFPNPVRSKLHLNWKSEHKPETMSLYSLDGSLIHQESFNTQLDLQNCKPGIYYLHIEAGKYGVIKEIVKE